jgi:UDP-N-acetyl-D-mannosaminuronic acid dehydrogenase
MDAHAIESSMQSIIDFFRPFQRPAEAIKTVPERSIKPVVSVIGLGYIGLPTAAAFASRGIQVIGVDIDKEVVNTINCGDIHIIEPELDMVVHDAVHQGTLRATTQPQHADAFLIAVPTPFTEGYAPDLHHIESAAQAIAPVLKKGDLVILESTSPVGTTARLAQWLAQARGDLTFPHVAGESSDIRIAHCPERVLPGQVLRELTQNDRVIGGITPKCSHAAAALYKVIVQGECVITNDRTAELCKLAENSFRDINIAYANELSLICDRLDISVWELIRIANLHPRVKILQPGPGVGGHCIAVDPWFIVHAAPDLARLIRLSREVNDCKPDWVINKVRSAVASFEEKGKRAGDLTIAILGLSFKPNIDDLRESPAVRITNLLSKRLPSRLVAVEPNIDRLPDALNQVSLMTFDLAIEVADIVVVLVAHREFLEKRYELVSHRCVIDTVGVLHG